MKKLLAMTLTLLMILCMFAGCSGGQQQSQSTSESTSESKSDVSSETEDSVKDSLINTDSLYPVVNKPVTLTLAVTVGATNEDPYKMWFFNYMTEKTGVQTDYMIIQASAWEEKKPIMLATDDLPDVFFGQKFTTTELMKYGKTGSFVAINDYIDKYGDMIKEKIDMVDGAWAGIQCPDGNIYSLPSLTLSFEFSGAHTSVNTKWLENTGTAEPKTLDDLYNVLKAFKDNDANGDGDPDNEIPLSGSSSEYPLRMGILQAYGFIGQVGQDSICLTRDGEAVYIPLHEKYYDYLVYMNKLWSEGLLDPDYFTQTAQQLYAKSEAGLVGYGPFRGAHSFTSENWDEWKILTPLVENSGDTPVTCGLINYVPGRYTVTKACENPDVAIRWANLFYTPEVCKMIMYGPEYGSEDDPDGIGCILYAEEDGSMHEEVPAWNPDEMGLWEYYSYNGPINSAYCFALDEAYQFQTLYGSDPVRSGIDYENHWRLQFLENVDPYRVAPYPPVYLSEENSNRVDELKTALDTYVESMEAKFIIGTEPLTNYDAFVEQLKSLGAEEYQKIYVDAYADYLANK